MEVIADYHSKCAKFSSVRGPSNRNSLMTESSMNVQKLGNGRSKNIEDEFWLLLGPLPILGDPFPMNIKDV